MPSAPDPHQESRPLRSAKRVVKTHTPRPDELSREAFEFIAAIDDYKRRHLRSFLDDREVLSVLFSLGYEHARFGGAARSPVQEELDRFLAAKHRYRDEEGRLFPTWSEIFVLFQQLGYTRPGDDDADVVGETPAA